MKPKLANVVRLLDTTLNWITLRVAVVDQIIRPDVGGPRWLYDSFDAALVKLAARLDREVNGRRMINGR